MEASTSESDIRLELPDDQPITARLAAAGSVRRELEDLLMAAEPAATQDDYRQLIVEQNVAGKRSDASRKKTWTNLKGRYLLDPRYPEFRVFRAAIERSNDPQDRGLICYLMMARTDRLLREMTLDRVVPMFLEPGTLIDNEPIEHSIQALGEAVGYSWASETLMSVRQHLLSALKDFGLLQGSAKKRITYFSPGRPVIIFAAQLGRLEGLTDRQNLNSRWFRLLGLDQDAVTDRLYMAAQERVIRFRKQAEVVELHLPEPGER